MKYFFAFILFCISGSLFAQNYPDDGLDRVRIADKEKVIQAEIKPINSLPMAKPDRFYYWYSANAIHATQGGFSGDLLNGLYNEYYLNKNLKTQGVFKKGLKEGLWKAWNEDGTLNNITNWKDGLINNEKPVPFLKKLNIFKKKSEKVTDTIPKKTENKT